MKTNYEAKDTPSNQPVDEKSFLSVIVHSFFIIPFLIAVFCVLLFTGVNLLTRENRSAYDYLEDVKTGGLTKRWQGAFELSKILSNPESVPNDNRFFQEVISAFKHAKTDDNRVRQYLALAMGRTQRSEFVQPLLDGLDSEVEENLPALIYSLGMLSDKRAAPKLYQYLDHPDARVRSLTVVALGNIGAVESIPSLKSKLSDSEPNVQWGAALSLAKLNDRSGKEVLGKMLDRKYLTQFAEVDQQEQNYLIMEAITAVGNLKEKELLSQVKTIAMYDQNMNVRALAMETEKKF